MIKDAGLAERAQVIMEKPFGTDLASARELNATVHEVFGEEQIFRIDHFLGKEAAQNILALRFANGLFEPIWNRNHIDHVQIDVPETLGVGGRAGFYEQTGAFRDMVVTHLFQVLAFVAMEPPTALAPLAITEEKNKVFRSLRPLDPERVVRGQYEGYRSEPGRRPRLPDRDVRRPECQIDNWRWSGVPFYLRTGKRMAESARIISIAFREPPQSMFPAGSGVGKYGPDHLTFDLDESSRLSLSFYGKRPGPGDDPREAEHAVLPARDGPEDDTLEAYERLIRDAMSGDHTLFTTAEGIERLWEVSAPLLEDPPEVLLYAPGSWGPGPIRELIAPNRWRLPFERRWREAKSPRAELTRPRERLASLGEQKHGGGVDERQVAERLREVADLAPQFDVVLLGEEPEVVPQAQQPLIQLARLVDPPAERQRPDEPERAGQELPLVPWKAVVGVFRRVARHEAVAGQVALDRLDGPDHALVVRRQEADHRDDQRARVELLRAVVLGERAALGVVAALADLVVDLVALSLPRRRAPRCRSARPAAGRGRRRPRP